MERDHDLDLPIVLVKLDGVLEDMEKGLSVDVPVGAGPARNEVAFDHLHRYVLLLQRVVEGGKEVEDQLGDRLLHGLERADELVHVELRMRHLGSYH
jgi:hypothetical protein